VLQASRADRSGTLRLAGLRAPVEIRFDARARPYVRAETLGDAFFAQGVLHVHERLWQMELLSRAGSGRLAEMLGPSLLDTDRELWRNGVPQLAARLEAIADAVTRERVGHYVDGVNAALDRLTVRPPELLLARIPLRAWTPSDVSALRTAMAFPADPRRGARRGGAATATASSVASSRPWCADSRTNSAARLPAGAGMRSITSASPTSSARRLCGPLDACSPRRGTSRLP
jgi:hypothetical protein